MHHGNDGQQSWPRPPGGQQHPPAVTPTKVPSHSLELRSTGVGGHCQRGADHRAMTVNTGSHCPCTPAWHPGGPGCEPRRCSGPARGGWNGRGGGGGHGWTQGPADGQSYTSDCNSLSDPSPTATRRLPEQNILGANVRNTFAELPESREGHRQLPLGCEDHTEATGGGTQLVLLGALVAWGGHWAVPGPQRLTHGKPEKSPWGFLLGPQRLLSLPGGARRLRGETLHPRPHSQKQGLGVNPVPLGSCTPEAKPGHSASSLSPGTFCPRLTRSQGDTGVEWEAGFVVSESQFSPLAGS